MRITYLEFDVMHLMHLVKNVLQNSFIYIHKTPNGPKVGPSSNLLPF